jgi:peptide/nickel transport system substrate-binding protein
MVVYLSLVAALLISLLPQGATAAPAEQGRSRTFQETGKTISGRILEVWESAGDYATAVYINGFPISDKRAEVNYTDGKTYQTQWFERARFEEHPENKAPYDVLLGLLGVYAAEGRTDTPFKGVDKPTGANIDYFAETKHSLRGDIRTYFYKYGGVKQFGFPISEQFQEQSKDDPSKTYTVQYFERQRMELHPENKGTPFEVLLGRLGAEQVGQTAEQPRTYKEETGTAVDAIRVGMSQEPDSLFSATSTLYVTTVVLGPVENGLVYRDDKAEWHGDLAHFLPTIDNGGAYYAGSGRDKRLSVKYKLKRGVKWSDGNDFDSNDVITWYRVIINPDVQVGDRSVQDKMFNVDNPDAYTVIVNYLTANEARTRYNSDPERFASIKDFADNGEPVVDPFYNKALGAYPQHIISQFEGHFGDIVSSDFARKPVGTGPYMVKEWNPGVSITLEANPNYAVHPEKPRIKTILIKIIADTNQLLAQLKTGDVDVATSDGLSLNQAPELDKLGAQGVTVQYTPATTWEHADFNLDKVWFQDVKVRQAIAHAINRKDIVDKVLFGKTVVMDTYLTPTNWASMMNPTMIQKFGTKFPLTKYEYNVDKAKQLLDQAGWTVGADGIRAKGGTKLAFRWMTTAANQQRAAVTQIVKENLKAVGIDATLEYIPAQQYFADDGPVYHRTGDVVEFAWVSGDDPSSYGLYHSSQIPSEDNNFSGQNIPGWKNARADELIKQANATISQGEREPLYAEHQMLFSQDLPSIPLFVRPNIAGAKTALKNFLPTGTNTPETWNAQEWWLAK